MPNVLTRKYGPLPGYAYAGIATVGGYLWIRHRSNSTAGSVAAGGGGDPGSDGTTETTGGGGGGRRRSYDPSGGYDYAGELYTRLASVEAVAQRERNRIDRLDTYKRNHPGNVAHSFRVITVGKHTTLKDLADRYGTTRAHLLRLNPELRKKGGHRHIHPGEKLLVPIEPTKTRAA